MDGNITFFCICLYKYFTRQLLIALFWKLSPGECCDKVDKCIVSNMVCSNRLCMYVTRYYVEKTNYLLCMIQNM